MNTEYLASDPAHEPAPAAADEAPPPAEEAAAPPVKRRRGVLIAGIAAAGVLVAAVAGGLIYLSQQPTALEVAGEKCGGLNPLNEEGEEPFSMDGMSFSEKSEVQGYFRGVVEVEDDGKTLIVATKPTDEDPMGVSTLALACVNKALNVPTWLDKSIGQTRSLDGRQTGEWDAYKAQWSYHPDNGLNLIIVSK